jgi:citrate lyase subunit beta / citryl-CoA lyase
LASNVTTLLRSLLFAPGSRPDRFAKAVASGADGVVFDLEDGVHPTKKTEARKAIAEFISASPRTACLRLVRVNAFGSPWIGADLESVGRTPAIDGVLLPKAETPVQVEQVSSSVSSRTVLPLLETARGILNALAIASADARVIALLFGAEDFTAQLGVPRTLSGDEILFARSQIVLAAAAIGADAIDTVFTNVTDGGLLEQDALRARAIGFHGKLAIHPGQIEVINRVFSPSSTEIDAARRIVDAYEAASDRDEGVVRLEDQMIDAPVVLRARRVLALAEALKASDHSA